MININRDSIRVISKSPSKAGNGDVGGDGISVENVAFREQFTGTGSQTQFQLAGTIENASFSNGAWDAGQIQISFPSHAVNQTGQPIYDGIVIFIRNRISVVSISATGLITLSHAPRSGVDFDVWYWYDLNTVDTLADYRREDFVASMEADLTDLEARLSALKFNDLSDVEQDFVSSSSLVTDDGKIPYYDFPTNKFITSETVTHGTVVLNAKTSVTTSAIAKGLPVYHDDFDNDIQVVELADADGAATFPCIGFTGESLNSTEPKHVITFGLFPGIDTTSTVSTRNPNGETWLSKTFLYLSKTPGGLTKERPTGVTEIQRIAQVIRVHETGGQIFIFNTARSAGLPNLQEGKVWQGNSDGHPVQTSKLAEIYKFGIGSVVETTAVTITEDTGTVSLNLEKSGTGDLTLLYSDGLTSFDCTPIKTITLTAGTDSAPQKNFIYILKSTGLLTASTTSFPATEHVPIASTMIQSSASVDADGAYKLHVWTDHVSLEGENGQMSHINSWIRSRPAAWISGSLLVPTVTPQGALDNLDIAVTAGVVRQLHPQNTNAMNTGTGDHVLVINDPTTPYVNYADLNLIIQDAAGTTLRNNNDRYTLVVWCVGNETGSPGHLIVNLPTGKYTGGGAIQDNNASKDFNKTANYTIPTDYIGTGFLIARITVKYTTVDGGTLEVLNTEDLRGLFPSTSAGGGSPLEHDGSVVMHTSSFIDAGGTATNGLVFVGNEITIRAQGAGGNQTSFIVTDFVVPSDYVSNGQLKIWVRRNGDADSQAMTAWVNNVVDTNINATSIIATADVTWELKTLTFGSTLSPLDVINLESLSVVDNGEATYLKASLFTYN